MHCKGNGSIQLRERKREKGRERERKGERERERERRRERGGIDEGVGGAIHIHIQGVSVKPDDFKCY